MAKYDFNRPLDWKTNQTMRWTAMRDRYGIDPDDGIAMWIADSDYPTAPVVLKALQAQIDIGSFTYGGSLTDYAQAAAAWQMRRHGWQVDPDWVVVVGGLGHGIAICIDTFTDVGDGVALFSPVYHEFRAKTVTAKRRAVEIPLDLADGRYRINWDRAAEMVDPDVKVLLFCSPQNPTGTVWTPDELRKLAEFADARDLLLISDEIHADLVYEGSRHVPTDIAATDLRDRIITITAASKAFNLPGLRTGHAIIPNPELRSALQLRLSQMQFHANMPGLVATQAAYSDEGEDWLRALLVHLDGNRRIFDAGINAIPGLHSMPLQSTFLAWVDFNATGMSEDEIESRLRDSARIATSPGPGFGPGGEGWRRFNLSLSRGLVEEAVARMQDAFSDLQ